MPGFRKCGYVVIIVALSIGMTVQLTGQTKPNGEIDLVGYAHTDLSWLWPKSETIHEVLPRTIQSVFKMIQDHPTMVYAMSAAQAYKWTERYYPDLFAQIKQKIASGNWEVVGGSWTEHSTNIPSGESLVRQHLYAKRYFKDKFGLDVKTAWLPDSFGFNWNLPQIYQKCGLDYFVTFKLQWQIERNDPPVPFPYHLFWWQGPDGSRVLSFLTVGPYNGKAEPDQLLDALHTMESMHHVDSVLSLYGQGDHGGGPMPDMMNRAAAMMKDPNYPTVRFTKGETFFREVQQLPQAKELPVVDDELYVKTHRGTFTTDSQVKRDNRQSEVLLMNAEKFSLIASQFGETYPQGKIQDLWEKVLFGQVHDNIDGSAMAEVYRDAATDYADIKAAGGSILNSALETIAKHANTQGPGKAILVFNPLAWERTGLVTLDANYFAGLEHFTITDSAGHSIPYQVKSAAGKACAIFFAEKVSGLGYKEYRLSATSEEPQFTSDLSASGLTLANSNVEVTIDPTSGNLTSLKRKGEARNFLRGDDSGAALEVWEDKPANAPKGEPAWNINLGADNKLDKAGSVKLTESGPVRDVVEVEKHFGDSTFVEKIVLYAHADQVNFELNVDWHEKYRFAKLAVPVNFSTPYATYEIPFGAIQRFDFTLKSDPGVKLQAPPRAWEIADRTKTEVAGQRWADVSNQAGDFGLMLLNDSKYGFSYQANTLRMSLIRGPRRGYANMPDTWSDQSDEPIVGIHHIRYALVPHGGTWQDADATRRGAEFNEPLLAKAEISHAGQLGASYGVLNVSPANVIVESVKKAEDNNSYIVRLYEAADKPATAALTFNRAPRSARETDMVEWDKFVRATSFDIKGNKIVVPVRPFEVKTIRVTF